MVLEPGEVDAATAGEAVAVDPGAIRPDLQEVIDAHALGLDEARPEATRKRHQKATGPRARTSPT